MYRESPFFHSVVDDAQREMARARLEIAERFASASAHRGFHERIASDYARAREAILVITGQGTLLDNEPVIRASIAVRNPYTDVLDLLQVELLRRARAAASGIAGTGDVDRLRRACFLSINGIAAAMQSTG